MKVLLINKTDSGGGAAVAANRLRRALIRTGVDTKLMVQDLKRGGVRIHPVDKGYVFKQKAFGRFLKERIAFLPHERDSAVRFAFSPANSGIDISEHPLVKEADIIHIHWINQGFLSIETLGRLLKTGKPVVWTQHDMWSFTGGCHYAGSCNAFLESCSFCPMLRKPHKNDLSAKLFNKKKDIYSSAPLTIVTCSKWLRTLASESKLLRDKSCHSIPNPIDTDFYAPLNKDEMRDKHGLPKDKKLILFGAANVNDSRKGFRYLTEALNILVDNFPVINDNAELVVFGKISKETIDMLPLKIHSFKFVSNPKTLVELYNAADIYVLPSLQDNLPNTVMESMACGTPVVGFSIGGVPEMVSHNESGYLAEVKNSLSLATGIYETLFVSDTEKLGENARRKVVETYSEKIVAEQYHNIYKSLLK